MKKKVIVMLLGASLVLALAGCGQDEQAKQGAQTEESGQTEDQETEESSRSEDQETEESGQSGDQKENAEYLAKFYEEQVFSEIMKEHQNEEINTIWWDTEGKEAFSTYEYVDEDRYVVEDSDSYMYIKNKDCEYAFDPSETEKLSVSIGMAGILEEEWDEFWNEPFYFQGSEEETVTELTESDEGIHIVIERTAEGMEEYFPYVADSFEPGDIFKEELELDPDDRHVKEIVQYLKKTDGTEIKMRRSTFSYDVEPYEPSEEMSEFMSGTDQKLTLITDPGTDQEKTYTKSCGKEGRIGVYFAEGYTKLYDDEECTVVHEITDDDEKVVYAVKGK